MKCYCVQFNGYQVEFMSLSVTKARLAALELYPGCEVLSVTLKPEWTEF
jgi:hypothetical protein